MPGRWRRSIGVAGARGQVRVGLVAFVFHPVVAYPMRVEGPMRRFCRSAAFWKDQGGGQVIEWPMLTAMIALLVVAAWAAFGTGFSDLLSAIGQTHTWAANQVGNATLE